ncbi:MAG: TRAP transporter small permease [Gammaproteobacteria bacterium]|nr:TRAP transporter small permease [Gammaproteobacteria bacterium]
MRLRSFIDDVLSIVFGVIFISLSCVVTLETILRKLFNFSIQGADELGGYALAVGATIAFATAVIGRNHIRVDVIHALLPRRLQALLNWTSIVLLAAFSSLIAWLAFKVLLDTMDYRSVAQTPWATPLIYPQSAWFAGLAVFALVSVVLALRATWLAVTGRVDALNEEFHPKSAKEELDDELQSVSQRGVDARPKDGVPT